MIWIQVFRAALVGGSLTLSSAAAEPDLSPILRLSLDQHATKIERIAHSPLGDRIATTGADGSVRFWSRDGRPIKTVRLPIGPNRVGEATALSFTSSGRFAFVAAKAIDSAPRAFAPRIYAVEVESGEIPFYFDVLRLNSSDRIEAAVSHISYSPDLPLFAVAAGPEGWRVYRGAEPVAGAAALDDPVSTVEFSEEGILAVAHSSGRLAIMQVDETGAKRLADISLDAPGQEPQSLAVSPDRRSIAVGYFGDSPIVDIVDLASRSQVRRLDVGQAQAGNLAYVAWSGRTGEPGWLFAGGSAQTAAGESFVASWRGGDGLPAVTPVGADAVTHLAVSGPTEAVYATADPSWGAVSAGAPAANIAQLLNGAFDARALAALRPDASRTVAVPPAGFAFRAAGRGGLAVSPDGSMIWVRPDGDPGAAFRFDMRALRLSRGAAPEVARVSNGFGAASERGVVVRLNRRDVSIDDVAAAGDFLAPDERILSVDAGDAMGGDVAFGADFSLLRFGRDGALRSRLDVRSAPWAVVAAADAPLVVSAHGDGTIRWYADLEDGSLAELAALFVHRDGIRWAAWTYDGFFAHSDLGGEELVEYQLNRDGDDVSGAALSFERLYRVMYRPDLVETALDDPARWPSILNRSALREVLAQATPLDAALRAYCPTSRSPGLNRIARSVGADAALATGLVCNPVTEVARGEAVAPDGDIGDAVPTGVRGVELVLDVGAAVGDVAFVDVFANGVNVGRYDAADAEGGALALLAPMPDVQTFYELRVYRANGVYDEVGPLLLRRSASVDPPPVETTLHVLQIGIDAYEGAVRPLKRALSDAEAITEAITAGGVALYDRVAVSPPLADEDATQEAVLAALEALAARSAPQDAVVIYMAGHGVVADDGTYHFITHNVRRLAETQGGGVSADLLTEALARIPAGRVLLILDSCYAGGFRLDGISRVQQESGRFLYGGSADYEQALDNPEGSGFGLFAGAMLDGLRGEAAIGGVVTALSLGDYLVGAVRSRADRIGWSQSAVFRASPGDLGRFPLVAAP